MNRWRFVAGVLGIAVVLVGLTRADDAPPPAAATRPDAKSSAATRPTPEVLALVGELSSDSFDTRQAAQKKLEELGPTLRPELKKLLSGELSEEARSRIVQAIHRIDQNDATHSVITMHYKDAPLMSVLTDLAAQSGGDLGLQQAALRQYAASSQISVDLDEMGFWQAMKAVQEVGGVTVASNGGSTPLGVMRTPVGTGENVLNPFSVTSGGFIIAPVSCQRNRAVGFSEKDSAIQTYFNLQLLVMAEPRIWVLSAPNSNWLKECVDDKGNSLMIPQNNVVSGNVGSAVDSIRPRTHTWRLQTNLQDAPGIGTTIALLKGELKFSIQIRAETFEVENLSTAKNVSKVIGENTYTMVELARSTQTEVSVRIDGPAASGGFSDLTSRILVLDDQDRVMDCTMARASNSSQKLDATFRIFPLNGAGKPAKLKWQVTAEQKQVIVPFEFKDLRLPVG